jgi:uncharacterized tellurite resistance protein B-like protein
MVFNGYLSKFSLPELFQFLEEGYKTGLLTVTPSVEKIHQASQNYYIWFQQGNIIAAANSLDNRSLAFAIVKRGWVKIETISKLFKPSSNSTLGLCLKSEGIIQGEQLSLLFRNQISSHVSPLFELLDAYFDFDFQAPLPKAEMTGLSMPATEATLAGLRVLRDWNSLERKMPEIYSRLKKTSISQPKFRLERLENELLEHANEQMSLREIALSLNISLDKVRQVAFRLIVSNLVEEIFGIDTDIPKLELESIKRINETIEIDSQYFTNIDDENKLQVKSSSDSILLTDKKQVKIATNSQSSKPVISKSYLESLTGFLKSQMTE